MVGSLRGCGVPTVGGESQASEARILLLANSWLRVESRGCLNLRPPEEQMTDPHSQMRV